MRVTIRETPFGECRYGAWLGETTDGQPNFEADTLEAIVEGLVATSPDGNRVVANGIAPFNPYRDHAGTSHVNPFGFWTFSIVNVVA